MIVLEVYVLRLVTLFIFTFCLVVPVAQGKDWSKPKALKQNREPVGIISLSGVNDLNCKLAAQQISPFRYFTYPPNDYTEFTPNREFETMNLVRSMQAVIVQTLNSEMRNDEKLKSWVSKFVGALKKGNYSKTRHTGAWERFDHGKAGVPDPNYGANIAILTASYLVSIIDELDLWAGDQRETIIAWGNKLVPITQKHPKGFSLKQQGRDNVALMSATYIAWGLVAGSQQAIDYGVNAFDIVLAEIGTDGAYEFFQTTAKSRSHNNQFLREDDKTIGLLVNAAHLGRIAGLQLYKKRNKRGKTVHDAIDWLMLAHFEPEKTKNAEFLVNQQRIGSGLVNYHWGWTAIYANDFPDEPLSKKSDELKPYGGWYHRESMGPTSCLFDRR